MLSSECIPQGAKEVLSTTMSIRTQVPAMSDAFDDESDNEIAAQKLPTPPQSENNPPAKKKSTKFKHNTTASAKVTKSTTGGKIVEQQKARTAKPRLGRPALKDISNTEPADGNETEEVDDFDALSEAAPKLVPPAQQPTPRSELKSAPRVRGRKSKADMDGEEQKPKKRGRKPAVTPEEPLSVIPETQPDVTASSKLAQDVKKGPSKPPRPAKKEISGTQPDPQPEVMDVDESNIQDSAENEQVPNRAPARPAASLKPDHRSVSRSRQDLGTQSRLIRAGSTSDNERNNDPSLRRKLQEMTRRFESLQLKYHNLRDIGVKQAEANFDKLKSAADEKTKAADELIARLRQDLAAQSTRDDEAEKSQKRLSAAEASEVKARTESKELKSTLSTAQNEVKSLQAMVAASRSAPHPVDSASKQPGSALKVQHGGPRTVIVGSAEAAKEAHKRMLKEELYGDLTGLIVRDVKKGEDGEDVYDCIQTGRNGSKLQHYTNNVARLTDSALHFYLSVAPNAADDKTNIGAPSYEDMEFTYTPLLDENRDRDLLAILPDYLADGEGICFPSSDIAKFYSRIVDTITKKIQVMDEEE